MKKILVLLSLFTGLFSSPVFAHVTNEKTIYDDIEFSEAKEEIVYLRGVNVIAHERGANLFKPQDTLTRAELAFWVATFQKAGGHDATREQLQKAAVDKGLLESLEGNATFADVNNAYFGGKAAVEKPDSELTKEEFALFMGQFLKEKVNGQSLFEMAGFEPGPTGVVENVAFEMEGEGENTYKVFRYTIDGKEVQVSNHPKILYGPVDLGAWEGKKVGESWLADGDGEEKVVQIIVVDQGQFTDDEVAQQEPNEQQEQTNPTPEQPEKGFPVVPVVGGVILLGILVWLMMKKKR